MDRVMLFRIAILLLSVSGIISAVNGLMSRSGPSWRPFWKLGLTRRQWAVQIGALVLAGIGSILLIAYWLSGSNT